MTQPPVVPQPAPAAKDNTQLFGILGIVLSLCCTPLGILFAVLSHLQANKNGKPATLAIVGYVVAALSIIVGIAYQVSR
jgi:threonine/homoserine/homoserine lactone efflux protein